MLCGSTLACHWHILHLLIRDCQSKPFIYITVLYPTKASGVLWCDAYTKRSYIFWTSIWKTIFSPVKICVVHERKQSRFKHTDCRYINWPQKINHELQIMKKGLQNARDNILLKCYHWKTFKQSGDFIFCNFVNYITWHSW